MIGSNLGYPYTCQQCGLGFHSTTLNARYCTRRCRERAKRARELERDQKRHFDAIAEPIAKRPTSESIAKAIEMSKETTPDLESKSKDEERSDMLRDMGFIKNEGGDNGKAR